MALRYIEFTPSNRYVIFSDSKSSLQAIQNCIWGNPVVQSILEKTPWIPSHVGIMGNEKADTAAKEALYARPSNETVCFSDFKCSVRAKEIGNKLHEITASLSTGHHETIYNRKDDFIQFFGECRRVFVCSPGFGLHFIFCVIVTHTFLHTTHILVYLYSGFCLFFLWFRPLFSAVMASRRDSKIVKLVFSSEVQVTPTQVFALLKRQGVAVPGDIDTLRSLQARNTYNLVFTSDTARANHYLQESTA